MNEEESILAELRKIAAWADTQRRITKWSFIGVAIFIPAAICFAVVMESRFKTSLTDMASQKKEDEASWSDVDWNVRRANVSEAIRIGETLIQKMPDYPEGHLRLASAYLAAGKPEQAREQYAHAFQLFPSPENEKLLSAIDKRIEETKAQPAGAAPL